MCSTLRPRSRRRTRRPRSVSSLAAQPPEMPEPTTMASNWGASMGLVVVLCSAEGFSTSVRSEYGAEAMRWRRPTRVQRAEASRHLVIHDISSKDNEGANTSRAGVVHTQTERALLIDGRVQQLGLTPLFPRPRNST